MRTSSAYAVCRALALLWRREIVGGCQEDWRYSSASPSRDSRACVQMPTMSLCVARGLLLIVLPFLPYRCIFGARSCFSHLLPQFNQGPNQRHDQHEGTGSQNPRAEGEQVSFPGRDRNQTCRGAFAKVAFPANGYCLFAHHGIQPFVALRRHQFGYSLLGGLHIRNVRLDPLSATRESAARLFSLASRKFQPICME